MSKLKINSLQAPRIVIRKSRRVLEIYDGLSLAGTFEVALGSSPELDKETEGDGRTPEGDYYIFTKNAQSRFHLSLGLSYPGPDDAERGLAAGLITHTERDEIFDAASVMGMPPQKTKLGGEIYIHGGGTESDWTEGCVALDNDEMSELFEAVPIGTRVTIIS